MVTGGAVCSNWACTESVRGEVSDGLPYLDPVFRKENNVKERETISVRELSAQLGIKRI